MSVQIKKITDTIVDSCDLPKDVVNGFPLLTFCGNQELYVDNHKGILSYQSDSIVLKTRLFQIEISGKSLYVEYYTRDSLKITGQIYSICFRS